MLMHLLNKVATTALLGFVVTSMMAMGVGFTVRQIIDSLRDVRLVLLALLANFVAMPLGALAFGQNADARRAAGGWPVLLGASAGAVSAQADRTCQGQPALRRWHHGASGGRHGWLPASRPAAVAPGDQRRFKEDCGLAVPADSTPACRRARLEGVVRRSSRASEARARLGLQHKPCA